MLTAIAKALDATSKYSISEPRCAAGRMPAVAATATTAMGVCKRNMRKARARRDYPGAGHSASAAARMHWWPTSWAGSRHHVPTLLSVDDISTTSHRSEMLPGQPMTRTAAGLTRDSTVRATVLPQPILLWLRSIISIPRGVNGLGGSNMRYSGQSRGFPVSENYVCGTAAQPSRSSPICRAISGRAMRRRRGAGRDRDYLRNLSGRAACR